MGKGTCLLVQSNMYEVDGCLFLLYKKMHSVERTLFITKANICLQLKKDVI